MGIEENRFVNSIADDFKCSICLEVFDNPIMTANCEHIFRKECINRWIGEHMCCPIDRTSQMFHN